MMRPRSHKLVEVLRGRIVADDVPAGHQDQGCARRAREDPDRLSRLDNEGLVLSEQLQGRDDPPVGLPVPGSLAPGRVHDQVLGTLADLEHVLEHPQESFLAPAPSNAAQRRAGPAPRRAQPFPDPARARSTTRPRPAARKTLEPSQTTSPRETVSTTRPGEGYAVVRAPAGVRVQVGLVESERLARVERHHVRVQAGDERALRVRDPEDPCRRGRHELARARSGSRPCRADRQPGRQQGSRYPGHRSGCRRSPAASCPKAAMARGLMRRRRSPRRTIGPRALLPRPRLARAG